MLKATYMGRKQYLSKTWHRSDSRFSCHQNSRLPVHSNRLYTDSLPGHFLACWVLAKILNVPVGWLLCLLHLGVHVCPSPRPSISLPARFTCARAPAPQYVLCLPDSRLPESPPRNISSVCQVHVCPSLRPSMSSWPDLLYLRLPGCILPSAFAGAVSSQAATP